VRRARGLRPPAPHGDPAQALPQRARHGARPGPPDPPLSSLEHAPPEPPRMMKKPRHARALGALAVTIVSLLVAPAGAVGTRNFQLNSLDEFKGGDLTGVSIDSNGNVRAGLSLGSLPIPDASSVWSSVELADGSVLLGTGSDGKVYRVTAGKSEEAATTAQMAVSAMAIAWNGE